MRFLLMFLVLAACTAAVFYIAYLLSPSQPEEMPDGEADDRWEPYR